MSKKSDKIRVLALCDSPTSATGFAQVARNILDGLVATGRFEVDIIGINYFGDYYDRQKFPYNIYPAMPQGYVDMYGRGRVISALVGNEERAGLIPGWDIIFTIQDSFIIEGLGVATPFAEQLRVYEELWKRQVDPSMWFKWIGYFPVDADLKENWVTRSIALPDYPVAYCDWGKLKMLEHDKSEFITNFNITLNDGSEKKKVRIATKPLKDRLEVIEHGVDLDVFKPLPHDERMAFRRQFFAKSGVKDDTFLVVNISRNQPRKDLTRTLDVFSRFKKLVPNSHLYLHSKVHDAGGSIHEMARNFNLVAGEDYTVPVDFESSTGYSIDIVNKIYNAADVCITTTLGEGWGFITTEAMAAKTPIIAPNITSILDIFDSYVPDVTNLNEWFYSKGGMDKVRGIPALAGSTSSEYICLGIEDNERIRPLTNVDDMVEKLVWVHDNPDKVKEITERAYEWVKTLSWDKIVARWEKIFMNAYENLEHERQIGINIDKTGRNEPCPCGSGKKFKRCHGSENNIEKYKDWLEQSGGE